MIISRKIDYSNKELNLDLVSITASFIILADLFYLYAKDQYLTSRLVKSKSGL